jgi:hypothetical protein
MVLQDVQSGVINNGSVPNPTTLFFPACTSFMRRGLYKAEVVVGGQQFPYYQNKFLPDGTSSLLQLNPTPASAQNTGIYINQTVSFSSENCFEAESFFDTTQYGFATMLNRLRLLCGTNYAAMGDYNTTFANNLTASKNTLNNSLGLGKPRGYMFRYNDSRDFILAFSLMKDDTNGAFTGLDTTQASIVQVNLHFNRTSDLQTCDLRSSYNVKSWCISDTVAQIQADASFVRK